MAKTAGKERDCRLVTESNVLCGPASCAAKLFTNEAFRRTECALLCDAPEAVKKFKTGRDWEGEAPAEPHGARTCWMMARQEARPPNFFTASLQRRGIPFSCSVAP